MVNFRKSKKVGPFRITVGKTGISASAGVPGARVSLNSKGEVRRTVGIPGTGVYDTKKVGQAGGKATPAAPSGARPTGEGACIVTLSNGNRQYGKVTDRRLVGDGPEWTASVELVGTSIEMELSGSQIELLE